MDKKQVLDMIEDEITGYKKWLNATTISTVVNALNNRIDVLELLAKRIEKEWK